MIKRFLVVCVFFLLIVSSIGSLSFGYKLNISDDKIIVNEHNILNYNNSVFSTVDTSTTNVYNSEPTSILYKNSDGNNIFPNVFVEGPWPMYCHDARHTSRSPYTTANNLGVEKWWFNTADHASYHHFYSFVNIMDDGTILLTVADGCIYAINPNGTFKWKRGAIWGSPIEAHPAIDEDGTIYVVPYYGFYGGFYAINFDGTIKWHHNFPWGVMMFTSPVIGEDGTIYLGTSNEGYLYAFYPNGTIKWQYKLVSDFTYSSPAIGNDGTIYLGDHMGYFYAIYPNGTKRWNIHLPDNEYIPNSPSIADDGTIYVVSQSSNPGYPSFLNAINPNDGSVKWKYQMISSFYVNPSLGDDGTIYINCGGYPYYSPILYAINADGTKKWTRSVDYFDRYSDPIISADGTIYVATSNHIFAFNPDGTGQWSKTIDSKFSFSGSTPAIAEDGTIYLGMTHYVENEPIYYLHAFKETDSNAPDKPIITGSKKIIPRVEYNFTISSVDPNGDDIYYYVNWGDSVNINEFGPYPSGEEVQINHTWETLSRFSINVRAQDINNLLSPWVTLKVNAPRTISFNSLFLKFLERLQNIFPIIRYIIRGR